MIYSNNKQLGLQQGQRKPAPRAQRWVLLADLCAPTAPALALQADHAPHGWSAQARCCPGCWAVVRPLALEGECLKGVAEAQDLQSGCPHLPMEREIVVGFFGPKCGSSCHMHLSRASLAQWPEQVGGPVARAGGQPWAQMLGRGSRPLEDGYGHFPERSFQKRPIGRWEAAASRLVHAQPRAWSLGPGAWALIGAFQEPDPPDWSRVVARIFASRTWIAHGSMPRFPLPIPQLYPWSPGSIFTVADLGEPHPGETSHLDGLVRQGHRAKAKLGWADPRCSDAGWQQTWAHLDSQKESWLKIPQSQRPARCHCLRAPPHTRHQKCALQPVCKTLATGPIEQMRKLGPCAQ